MPLSVGARIGPYEILAPIGAGGMGEVYRARDTRLKREVALKVLPEAFATDPDRMARFQREAEVLASLNHPNIAHIYGVEERAIAMELVEGRNLLGPLPVETALRYAKQIAEALEYAHERGVIHRDLKPANVKVTPEETVKLLDFGLAKAVEDPAVSADDPSNSPTLTLGATRVGVILGTAAYMSPEQASGKVADRRADIWSFGAVLYEMLAGRKAFPGESASDTLATVLKLDPDWSALPNETPASIVKLLRRCLTKDRRQRLQAIGEARIALEAPEEEKTGLSAPLRSRFREVGWFAAGVLAVAIAGWALWPARPAAEKVMFSVPLPEKGDFGNSLEVSPDGRKVAFNTTGPEGGLWVRDVDSLEARLLPGTQNAAEIFWSPDSRYIAFGVANQLKKIAVSGGPAQTLCETSGPIGRGAWNKDGVIIFGGIPGPMRRVSEAGGVPVDLTPATRGGIVAPTGIASFLPDGRHFLYLLAGSPAVQGMYAGSIDAKPEQQPAKPLMLTATGARYAADPNGRRGRLFFVRDGTLMAQPFDAGELRLTGEPVPLAEQVGNTRGGAWFSVSPSGVLAYRTGSQGRQFQYTWFDRQGKSLGVLGEPTFDHYPQIAPDGSRAVVRDAETYVPGDLWMLDFARGTRTRFTFRRSLVSAGIWSPDGSRIAFSAGTALDALHSIYEKASSGAGEEKEIFTKATESMVPGVFSPDGRFLLYSPLTGGLWVLPLQGDRKPVQLLSPKFGVGTGSFSPDGHWIAYLSVESGKPELYVRPFLASGPSGTPSLGEGQWQVSKDGVGPNLIFNSFWRTDGKEILFNGPNGSPMAVEISGKGAAFEAGIPKPLFTLPRGSPEWTVTADGQKFLVPVPAGPEAGRTSITVVLNWQAGLTK